jgi:hypothetical protein
LGVPDGGIMADKLFAVILTYGDSDPYNSGAVNALRMFQDAFNYLGADCAGMLYGSGTEPGEIARNEELMEKAYQLGLKLSSSA